MTSLRPVLTSLLSVAALAMFGCEGDAPQKPTGKSTTPTATQPTAEQLANMKTAMTKEGQPKMGEMALPAGHPPLDGGAAGAAPPPAELGALNLKYAPPADWKKEAPRSAMRADQYRLPRAGGDAEDGELAVFNQSIGGGVEANIQRWRGQFKTADGKPIPDEAFLTKTLDVGGMKVTYIDTAGAYSGMMGMGPSMGDTNAPKQNYRLLGAIVETPDGPWYFKATGPSETMAAQRDAFMAFLQTMQYAGDNPPPPAHGAMPAGRDAALTAQGAMPPAHGGAPAGPGAAPASAPAK